MDIPLPLMMVQDEGDVPLDPVAALEVVVPVTKSSKPEYTEAMTKDIADKKDSEAKKQRARTGKNMDRPVAHKDIADREESKAQM